MMNEFTKRAKRIINELAQKEAKRMHNDTLGPEHILLGMLQEEDSLAVKILRHLNVDFKELKKEIERRSFNGGQMLIDPLPDKYQKIIEYAKEEAKKLFHSYVGTEHILLALLRDNNNVAAASLMKFNIRYSVIKAEISRILGVKTAEVVRRQRSESGRTVRNKSTILSEHSRDLNQMVKDGKLSPVIGREKEIQRIIQILCRKTKNNPILIGDAGVGKTAIVEGLAERIVSQKIPELLHEKVIISLDLASLLAGTKYRGEFEDRMKHIIKELKDNQHLIVFIDELHTLIGAGAAEGAIDAANILKPALARGEIQCIGATTMNEYRKYVEKDSALERRFQSILVKEPSIEDSIWILQGLAESFGKHHRVEYSDEALELAVKLAKRHIADRFLPDKAIDIIDEAGARARLSHSSRPKDIRMLQDEIKKLVTSKEDLVKRQEYENAAKIRDEINSKRLFLDSKIKAWKEEDSSNFVKIGADEIYTIMNLWTGIPLDKMRDGEGQRLLELEKDLQKLIVGQDQAVTEVSHAVRRARTGFKDQNRPSGSFIFLGPTGVGKTELARSLAKILFGDEKKLFRLDMSEFMEMHSVSKLIGSPPGYIGYEESGQLCEYIRRNPYSIILFDEMEKAHPDVYNILLQILDDGSLTDSHGRRVDFSETIIIITSNVGSRDLFQRGSMGFSDHERDKKEVRKEKLMDELKKMVSPEFLNRIDEVIIFQTLEAKHVHRIIDNFVAKMNDLFIEKKVKIILEDTAKDYLAERGFSEKNGARALRKVLQKEIIDYLSIQFLNGKLTEPAEFTISAEKKEEEFAKKKGYLYEKLIFKHEDWVDFPKILKEKMDTLQAKMKKREKERLTVDQSAEKEKQQIQEITRMDIDNPSTPKES